MIAEVIVIYLKHKLTTMDYIGGGLTMFLGLGLMIGCIVGAVKVWKSSIPLEPNLTKKERRWEIFGVIAFMGMFVSFAIVGLCYVMIMLRDLNIFKL